MIAKKSSKRCDAMIWTGKYAATGALGVNVLAAEYPENPGKFGRRPAPWCWTPEDGDQGSKTTWSRDMAVAGLFPYAWMTQKRDILERHANYGKEHGWQMGDPIDDGRTIYSPSLRGLLFKAIHGLGGPVDNNALWPTLYPSGLVDYQAHLLVMGIWLQGEIAATLNEADAVPRRPAPGESALQISDTMYQRLEEQAAREPLCPLFQTVYGFYSGNLSPAIDTLLSPEWQCSYVRCDDLEQCRMAEWLFAAFLTLSRFPG